MLRRLALSNRWSGESAYQTTGQYKHEEKHCQLLFGRISYFGNSRGRVGENVELGNRSRPRGGAYIRF
jgi:hypothetical protein